MTGNANMETQGTTKLHTISRVLHDRRIRLALRALAILVCIYALLHAIQASADFQRAKDASQALSDGFTELASAAFPERGPAV